MKHITEVSDGVYLSLDPQGAIEDCDAVVFFGSISPATSSSTYVVKIPVAESNKVADYARSIAAGVAAVELAKQDKLSVTIAGNKSLATATAAVFMLLSGASIEKALEGDIPLENDIKNIIAVWVCMQVSIADRVKLLDLL